MAVSTAPMRKNNWVNIVFFTVTTVAGVIGAPIYLYVNGISASEMALFVFYVLATGFGITVGYHRLFAHSTFKTNPVIRFLLLFFGSAAFEQSALQWSAQHRDHHRYVDTDRDPYSIRKGFFYAHLGWLVFWEHETNYDNVANLQRDAMVMHQHRYYVLWATLAGIVVPGALGALTGHFLGALLLAVCLRLTLVYHATFFINSVCHTFGKATYDIDATARDNWLVAFFTFGEGYHNFHHRFAADYRNGVRWYQFDPSKWVIALLAKLRLASDLRRVSNFSILAARIAGEKGRVAAWLKDSGLPEGFSESFQRRMRLHYETVRESLRDWEAAVREYHAVVTHQVTDYSVDLKKAARRKMADARIQFKRTRAGWNDFISECPAV